MINSSLFPRSHVARGNEYCNMKLIKIILDLMRAFFSITFIKRTVYSFTYYLLNNIHGIIYINKGKNVHIRPNVMFRHPERIYIGDNSRINVGCKLWAGKVKGIDHT